MRLKSELSHGIAAYDKRAVRLFADKLGTVNSAFNNLAEDVGFRLGVLISPCAVKEINIISVLNRAAAVAGNDIRSVLNALDIYFLIAVTAASEKRNKAHNHYSRNSKTLFYHLIINSKQ